MKVTWPEIYGPSLCAAIVYVGFAIAITVWLWTFHPLAGLVAGAILAGIAYVAAESHLATERLRQPPTQPTRPRGEDPESTWES